MTLSYWYETPIDGVGQYIITEPDAQTQSRWTSEQFTSLLALFYFIRFQGKRPPNKKTRLGGWFCYARKDLPETLQTCFRVRRVCQEKCVSFIKLHQLCVCASGSLMTLFHDNFLFKIPTNFSLLDNMAICLTQNFSLSRRCFQTSLTI